MVEKIDNSLISLISPENGQNVRNPDDPGFADTFREALRGINELQENAASTAGEFVRGEITDLHQVMIDAEKARIGLELMLEIRNKLIEGYQELMRMQL